MHKNFGRELLFDTLKAQVAANSEYQSITFSELFNIPLPLGVALIGSKATEIMYKILTETKREPFETNDIDYLFYDESRHCSLKDTNSSYRGWTNRDQGTLKNIEKLIGSVPLGKSRYRDGREYRYLKRVKHILRGDKGDMIFTYSIDDYLRSVDFTINQLVILVNPHLGKGRKNPITTKEIEKDKYICLISKRAIEDIKNKVIRRTNNALSEEQEKRVPKRIIKYKRKGFKLI